MASNIRANGRTVCSTEKANIKADRVYGVRAVGRTELVSNDI